VSPKSGNPTIYKPRKIGVLFDCLLRFGLVIRYAP
jgi:hypothetical protein